MSFDIFVWIVGDHSLVKVCVGLEGRRIHVWSVSVELSTISFNTFPHDFVNLMPDHRLIQRFC